MLGQPRGVADSSSLHLAKTQLKNALINVVTLSLL